MKPKNLLFIGLLVLSLAANKAQAQTWAPIGATWHYTFGEWYFPPYLQTFSKIVSDKDTIINTINCRKLKKFETGANGIQNYVKNFYMYESNQKVYYYVDSLNRFCLLYDFAANAGDWWILDEYEGCLMDTIKVISTDSTIINGHKRKTLQLVSSNFNVLFDGITIEGIGNLYNMFPVPDMSYEGPLRCYQDNTLGLYETGITPTCETTTIGIEEYPENENISIYPNPADDHINLLLGKNKNNVLIKIINTKGQVILTTKMGKNNETIDISDLPAGMYMVQFIFAEKTINKKLQILK